MKLSIRECGAPDIHRIVGYFLDADLSFLDGMGVDPNKLPERAVWMCCRQRSLMWRSVMPMYRSPVIRLVTR